MTERVRQFLILRWVRFSLAAEDYLTTPFSRGELLACLLLYYLLRAWLL